jgi:hypothetical protein
MSGWQSKIARAMGVKLEDIADDFGNEPAPEEEEPKRPRKRK